MYSHRPGLRFRILFLMIAIILTLSACGQSREARYVQDKIDLLGEVTLESGPLIEEIDTAYSALSDREKRQVGNRDALAAAREQYDALKAEQEQKREIEDAIEILEGMLRLLEKRPASCGSEMDTAIKAAEMILLWRIAQSLA